MTQSAVKIIARLVGFLRPFWWQLLASVLLGVGTTAAGIGLLGTSAWLIARAAQQPSIAVLQVAIVGVRFFGIMRGVLRYLERLSSHSINFRLLAGLRTWFYRALLPLAPARLQDYRAGDLLSRIVADVETLENFYVRALAPFLSAAIVTLGIGLFTAAWDRWLGIALSTGLIFTGALLPMYLHHVGRNAARAQVQVQAQMSAFLVDTLQGLSDLTVFGQKNNRAAQLKDLLQHSSRVQLRQAWIGGWGSALGIIFSGSTLLAILIIAIQLVTAGQLDGVMLAVMALLTISSFEAVNGLPAAGQQMEKSLAAARRLFEMADAEASVREPVNPVQLASPIGSFDLRIANLEFRYSPDLPGALVNFSLDLPPGKHIALVGPSGAGKSTLVNLLLRFWDVPPETIFLNKQDIRAYAADDVHRCMAVITQTSYLFSTSLRQNLLLAKPDASEEELEAVLRQVGLWEWCTGLPERLETWVGEHGVQLSGGERQRLAVARALLQNTPLLVVDEFTANLDTLNEQQMLETLEQVSQGRSLLMITHRMKGLERMDEIIVLSEGRVVQRGKHAELLREKGLYADWWKLQNQVWLDNSESDGTSDPGAAS